MLTEQYLIKIIFRDFLNLFSIFSWKYQNVTLCLCSKTLYIHMTFTITLISWMWEHFSLKPHQLHKICAKFHPYAAIALTFINNTSSKGTTSKEAEAISVISPPFCWLVVELLRLFTSIGGPNQDIDVFTPYQATLLYPTYLHSLPPLPLKYELRFRFHTLRFQFALCCSTAQIWSNSRIFRRICSVHLAFDLNSFSTEFRSIWGRYPIILIGFVRDSLILVRWRW